MNARGVDLTGTTLVTGASGFVGRRLLERLAGKESVVGLSRGRPDDVRIPWIELDLARASREPSLEDHLAAARPSRILHLAALADPRACEHDERLAVAVNVLGAQALFRAAARLDVPVVFASTAAVYAPSAAPLREDALLGPRSVYGRTKRAAEDAAAFAAREGARIVVARPFNHSGRGQSDRYALGAFAKRLAAARGTAEPIEVGNLDARRDILHVDDVIDAYLLLFERGVPGEAYNVCSGTAVEMGALFRGLAARLGYTPEELAQRTRPAPGLKRRDDPDVLVGDPAKLKALGWLPARSLDQLLDELAESVAPPA